MFRGPFYSLFTQAAASFGSCHNMRRAHVYTETKPTLQSFENCSCRFVRTFVFVAICDLCGLVAGDTTAQWSACDMF